MRLPAAPSSTLPRDLWLGAALGSLTRAFCAASKPPRWGSCRALGFDCFGDGLEARQLSDAAALMGARFRAKRLDSDLDLISSSGSLPVQPAISGLGHVRLFAPWIGPPDSERSRTDVSARCLAEEFDYCPAVGSRRLDGRGWCSRRVARLVPALLSRAIATEGAHAAVRQVVDEFVELHAVGCQLKRSSPSAGSPGKSIALRT